MKYAILQDALGERGLVYLLMQSDAFSAEPHSKPQSCSRTLKAFRYLDGWPKVGSSENADLCMKSLGGLREVALW